MAVEISEQSIVKFEDKLLLHINTIKKKVSVILWFLEPTNEIIT